MMTSICIRSVSLLMLLGLLTQAAIAETPDTKSEPQTLVVGEWYKVSLLNTIDDEIEGILVKQTDEWVVLGRLASASTDESKFPLLDGAFGPNLDVEDIPLIGKKLVKRTTFYHKDYFSLPRSRIKSVENVPGALAIVKAEFEEDSPPLTSFGTVVIGKNETASEICSESITVTGNEVTASDKGDRKKFSLADVQYVRQSVPFDHRKFLGEYERKQAAK